MKKLTFLILSIFFLSLATLAFGQGFSATDSTNETSNTTSDIKGADIGTPRIIVVPDANVSELSPYGRSAARVVIGELSKKRFMVVNSSQIQQLHDEVHQMMKVNTINQAAAKIGLKYSAEVVMALEVTHTIKGYDEISKQAAANGTVAGQVYESTTGQILYDGSFTNEYGSGATKQEAAQSALQAAATDYINAAMPEILGWWETKATSGKNFTVRLWKVNSYNQVNAFKKAIENTPGCTDIVQRSVSIDPKAPNNFAELSVFFKGRLDQLQDAVFDSLKQSQAFQNLDIRSAKGDQVDFTL